ncbi:26S proteasome non-ATPase regulatory subunit 10 [Gryllus bimaculatus]|nr:26S proteasome non-ATPase regulatory subunit 10 [Gryllus bimaculatus]
MDPQDVPGIVPETHHSLDQRPADDDLQVVPQPVIMNAGERDEIQEENLLMDDDDSEDYESGLDFSASSDSNRDGTANNGQAEASDTSDSEEGQNDESDSDHDSDRDVYHYPRWNLVAVDENGRPRELHIHRPSTLRQLVARTQTTNSSYVFWYMLRAVFAGSLPVVSTLLALGMDPNDPRLRYPDGATALHVAAFRGHAEIVVALLRFGARVSAVCNARCTPLHLAVIPGWLQVAVGLLPQLLSLRFDSTLTKG